MNQDQLDKINSVADRIANIEELLENYSCEMTPALIKCFVGESGRVLDTVDAFGPNRLQNHSKAFRRAHTA